ncbi:MAG: RidA family protein [Candidatus Eisenbacteria bacterium]|nr:RidA family protein [Candidatus Eisenbacteria bacterium]
MNEAERAANLPPTPQYQYAQRVGNQLFVAGQVPHDALGQLVGPDDPYQQAMQCLHNLVTVLTVHGFAVSDVRRLVIYVVGEQANLSKAWNAVAEQFGGQVPPATLLGVARLGYIGQIVEVDATVLKE